MGDSNDRRRNVGLDETLDSTPPTEKSAIESGETLHASGPSSARSVIESGETLHAADATLASQSSARERAASIPLPEVRRDSYVIERELARGGMGRILVAEDRRLSRPVALKELLVANAALADRFSREVRITARLQHPGIVPVYEAGHWPGGEPFYAMKLVSGRSLEKVVEERTTLDERLRLVPNLVQLAEAMAYAHDQRIIHRDLKPANVLVGEYGETVVIDWGLAKDLDEATDETASSDEGVVDSMLTQVGAVVGTPAYMSPEQARGERVDARADVYALGALMWHVLAGTSPVSGSSVDTVIQRVREGVATRPLAEVVPDVPPELATIVDHAMATDPADRYPSARELAADLSAFQTGRLVARHRYSNWELIRRWIRNHRTAVFTTLALVVGAAIVGAIALRQVVAERDKARSARIAGLEEQGRIEMKAGRPQRAAVYLAEAYSTADAPDEGLRVILGEAMRAVDRHIATWQSSKWLKRVAWLDDSRLLAIADDGSITRWNITTDERTELLAPNEQLRSPTKMIAAERGGLVATIAGRTLAIVTTDKPVVVPLRLDFATDLAIAPNSESIFVTSIKGTQEFDAKGGFRGLSLPILAEPGEMRCGAQVFEAGVRDMWCGHARNLIATTDRLGVVAPGESSKPRFLDAHGIDDERAVVAMDANGSFAAVGRDTGVITVWDLATGLIVWTIDAHTRRIEALAFDRDAKRLASVAADGVVHIWRLDAPLEAKPSEPVLPSAGGLTARIVRETVVTSTDLALVGHDELVSWVAISPTGDAITAGARDGRVLRWDARTGKTLQRWEQPSAVTDGSIANDLLATGGTDGTVHVWRGRDLVAQLGGHTSAIHAVAWSPRGDRLLTAADSTLRLWRATGELLTYLPCEQPIGKAWWITDRFIAVAGEQSFQLWDIDRGGLLIQLPHGFERAQPASATAEPSPAFAAGRIGWTGVVQWPFARETRTASTIAALLDARVPWKLVDGALVPAHQTALATDELLRASLRNKVYDFSGEVITGVPQSPDFTDLAGTGPVASVRDAVALIRSGDRAKAAITLANIDDTLDARANLALAWCRHWLGDHAAAYAAARHALAASPDATAFAATRDTALRFAAWAALPVKTIVADAQIFKLAERELRFAASQTYESIGKLDLAAELIDIPPTSEREPRLRALLQLARISNRRTDPNGAVGFLETAAKLAPPPTLHTPASVVRCSDVAVETEDKDLNVAVASLTERLAASSFSAFEKTFDHRYARAARKLYAVLRDSYGLDAAFVTKCEAELDRLATEALQRTGSLDKALLRRAFKSRSEIMRACYERGLAIDPQLAGTVYIRFTAIPGGTVDQVDVVADSDRPLMLELATCVRERVADIGLPRLATGESTIVNYPLTFRTETTSVAP